MFVAQFLAESRFEDFDESALTKHVYIFLKCKWSTLTDNSKITAYYICVKVVL